MSSSKSNAPMVDDTKMTINANTDWPAAQQSNDMVSSNNDQQLSVVPTDFDFNSMSTNQYHGAQSDYHMFDGGSSYDYSAGNDNMIGGDMAQGNHFSGDFQEAVDAKTPAYPAFDYNSSDVFNSSSAQVGHEFQPSLGAQTPFDPSLNTYEAKTPYVAPMPPNSPRLSTADDQIPELDLDVGGAGAQPSADLFSGAQPSTDLFFGAQPSIDFSPVPQTTDFSPGPQTANFSSGPQTTDFSPNPQTIEHSPDPENTDYQPPTSPMDMSFPPSAPSTPIVKPASDKRTPTPRKAKTKAKTAIAGDEDTENETRSLLTSRGKGKAKAKQAAVEDEQDERDNDEETPTAGSSNKGKGRKGAATSKASTSTPARKPRAKKVGTDTLTTMGHQRVRKAAKNGIAQTKPIPHTFEECDEADQTLINMRDNGHTWAECKARYAELEGVTHGASTIPNRYDRLKTAFIEMRDEDNLRLFDIKKALEDDFNSRKWGMIAAEIVKAGGDQYDPEDLRRRFKQLMDKAGFKVNEGLARKDADFKVDGADEEDEDDDDAMGGGDEYAEFAHMDIDDEDDDGGDSLAY